MEGLVPWFVTCIWKPIHVRRDPVDVSVGAALGAALESAVEPESDDVTACVEGVVGVVSNCA